jgi:aryl-alcohol dehydrogenase-like predicted oxidoreductase
MRYRLLGNTGLYVSELSLGTSMHGGQDQRWKAYGALTQAESDEVIGTAIDGGINFIDTGNSYGGGESEVRVGQSLRNISAKREDVLIGTKVYIRTGPGVNSVGASRGNIMNALETSLKKLQLDYVDLYTIHSYDPLTPLEETLRALDDLVRQGKIRYIGCSNFSSWQVMKALGISERKGYVRFEALESLYTIASRELERDVIPMLLDQKVGLLAWGPLASGILSGKYSREGTGPAGSRLTMEPGQTLRRDLVAGNVDRAFDAVDALAPIAAAKGITMAQLALAWLLAQKATTSVVFGARTVAQVTENLGAIDVSLAEEDLKALAKVNALKTEYPAWKQKFFYIGREPADHVPVKGG